MSRQRWGTFSVNDHLMPRAFVADVMLYDQLVIPHPPNGVERKRWDMSAWEPDLLDRKLEILGDRATIVPWDQTRWEYFRNRKNLSQGISFDIGNIQSAMRTKVDPFHITRMVLAQEGLPPIPASVTKVWAMAAYPAMTKYESDRQQTKEEQRQELSMVIANRFFVPEEQDLTDDQLLKKALELASADHIRVKRDALYKWQDTIIEEQIPPDKAIREMEDLLDQYNKALSRSRLKMIYKYVFLAIEVGLGLAGAKLGAPIASATAIAGITRFAIMERKPEINAGDCDAAAMIHDFQREFRQR